MEDAMTTQTSQHTPGPWTIERDEEYPGGIPNHVIYGARHVVARLMHDETSNAEANARLIAAAPEMPEWMRFAIESMDTLARQPGIDAIPMHPLIGQVSAWSRALPARIDQRWRAKKASNGSS